MLLFYFECVCQVWLRLVEIDRLWNWEWYWYNFTPFSKIALQPALIVECVCKVSWDQSNTVDMNLGQTTKLNSFVCVCMYVCKYVVCMCVCIRMYLCMYHCVWLLPLPEGAMRGLCSHWVPTDPASKSSRVHVSMCGPCGEPQLT